MRAAQDQRGSALLIAVIAVALATVLAIGLIERAQRDLARTEAFLAGERSWQYALGMETLVERLLGRALAEGLDPATLTGSWTEPFEVPGGYVQGRLLDQQGRFNLNALASPDRVVAAGAEASLVRLLEHLALPRSVAAELAEWLTGPDAGAARPGRVGDGWYGSQTPPYRVPGLPLSHVSELRWVRSVDAEVYQRLLPHVTALPETRLSVNVNSTSPEVLGSLVDGLDIEQARRVLADGPFTETAQLAAHPLMAGRLTPEQQVYLGVTSRWFMAQARVVLDGIERDYHRLIHQGGSGYDFRYLSQGLP
ncbi:MAG: general secretion pathway protein GspK [Wenzhouxiangella sp.]|nr:MAG: general secretion pathway protein GspK [Wenzhouxiangella sp.]